MINQTDILNKEKGGCFHVSCMKRLSWTAVFVGALVGVGITFLLNLFSIAIGLSAITTNNGSTAVAAGGLVGMAIGIIASMFTAGWVSGYLGRPSCRKRNLGVLYGFTTWCLALIMTVLMASHISRFVGVYTNFIATPVAVIATKPLLVDNTSASATTTGITVDNQKAAENLTRDAFIVFALFFIGALASCFGGHCGMCCRCHDEKCDAEHVIK